MGMTDGKGSEGSQEKLKGHDTLSHLHMVSPPHGRASELGYGNEAVM